MSETEFAALGIKLGHRRKLQREAARRHSWPEYRALPVRGTICCVHEKSAMVASEIQSEGDAGWNWVDHYTVDSQAE